MPNLSHKAALQFWSDYPDPMIFRALTFMESVEPWTFDDNAEFEDAVSTLGDALDNIDGLTLENHDNFIKLAAHLKASRFLLLLQTLDTATPGAASAILSHAESTGDAEDTATLFLKRNLAFERLRLLAQIYSKERLDLIETALEHEDA